MEIAQVIRHPAAGVMIAVVSKGIGESVKNVHGNCSGKIRL